MSATEKTPAATSVRRRYLYVTSAYSWEKRNLTQLIFTDRAASIASLKAKILRDSQWFQDECVSQCSTCVERMTTTEHDRENAAAVADDKPQWSGCALRTTASEFAGRPMDVILEPCEYDDQGDSTRMLFYGMRFPDHDMRFEYVVDFTYSWDRIECKSRDGPHAIASCQVEL